jgi:hypothetical protein
MNSPAQERRYAAQVTRRDGLERNANAWMATVDRLDSFLSAEAPSFDQRVLSDGFV